RVAANVFVEVHSSEEQEALEHNDDEHGQQSEKQIEMVLVAGFLAHRVRSGSIPVDEDSLRVTRPERWRHYEIWSEPHDASRCVERGSHRVRAPGYRDHAGVDYCAVYEQMPAIRFVVNPIRAAHETRPLRAPWRYCRSR